MSDAPRPLGVIDITGIAIGGMIGVGVFFTPARVARLAGSETAALCAWGLGAVLALFGGLTLAGLAARVPRHGGTFVYLLEAFGRLPAFLYGWTNLLVIQSGAMAVVALVLVEHVEKACGVSLAADATTALQLRTLAAAGAILAFALLNYLGLRVGARAQLVLIGLKLVAVFGLALLSLFHAAGPAAASAPVVAAGGETPSFLAALLPVMFCFGGWQQGSFVAGAARRPARDVPLGLFCSVVVVAAAYLSINFGLMHVLGFARMAHSGTVAADACAAMFGDVGGRVMAAVVAVSAAGILNTICLAPPYVLHAMAEERLVPGWLGRLHPRFGGPAGAVLFQGFWSMGLLLVAQLKTSAGRSALDELMDGVVFADWVFFALAGMALLRIGGRPGGGTFRVPLVVPLVFTLLALLVALGSVFDAVRQSLQQDAGPDAVAWSVRLLVALRPTLFGVGALALGAITHVVLERRNAR